MSKFITQKIFDGLVWVEVPEADLRLCCGCPPDATKFLKREGLLWGGEGRAHGPNAFLIADSRVHNGKVSSFSEFPIMQMLYMQGAISSEGRGRELPILMGMRENVDLQTEYLLRGNYGLLTKEELLSSGCDEETADFLYAIKMWFGEGKILDKKDLCQTLYIDKQKSEIKSKVFIKRIGFNLFELCYEDEKITVDLTKTDEAQPLPYTLHDHRFARIDFGVVHTGEGNGWESENPCMGSILVNNGKLYAIDAGPGFQENISRLGLHIHDLDGIFLTHIHDDHFAGFTDMLIAAKQLKFFATGAVRFTAQKKLSALLGLGDDKFFAFFQAVDLKPDVWNEFDGMEVMPFFSPHPVETNAYSFRKKTGKEYKVYTHLADTISLTNLEKIKGLGKREFPNAELDKLKEKYLAYADVKKVDIGGGLIHGVKEDYGDDPSCKIVFSHHKAPSVVSRGTEIPGGCFGEQDVLISGQENAFKKQRVIEILLNFFPTLTDKECSSIYKDGRYVEKKRHELFVQEEEYFSILLNGAICEENVSFNRRIVYTSESIIGLSEIIGDKPKHLYAYSSVAGVMQCPRTRLIELISQTHWYARIQENKALLKTISGLFLSKGLFPAGAILSLFAGAQQIAVKARSKLQSSDLDHLYIVVRGNGWYVASDKKKQKVEMGDYFGGNALFNDNYGNYEIEFSVDSEMVKIPSIAFENIPLIWWMIYEKCTTLSHVCKTS